MNDCYQNWMPMVLIKIYYKQWGTILVIVGK